jgi:hypothetical protein
MSMNILNDISSVYWSKLLVKALQFKISRKNAVLKSKKKKEKQIKLLLLVE